MATFAMSWRPVAAYALLSTLPLGDGYVLTAPMKLTSFAAIVLLVFVLTLPV